MRWTKNRAWQYVSLRRGQYESSLWHIRRGCVGGIDHVTGLVWSRKSEALSHHTLAGFLALFPSRRCRPESRVSALLWGHGDQPTLAADLSATSPHGGHYAGYLRLRNLGR